MIEKNIQIKRNIEKAEEALKTCEVNISINSYDAAANRLYYGMYYITFL